jgi:hypothetical protein
MNVVRTIASQLAMPTTFIPTRNAKYYPSSINTACLEQMGGRAGCIVDTKKRFPKIKARSPEVLGSVENK